MSQLLHETDFYCAGYFCLPEIQIKPVFGGGGGVCLIAYFLYLIWLIGGFFVRLLLLIWQPALPSFYCAISGFCPQDDFRVTGWLLEHQPLSLQSRTAEGKRRRSEGQPHPV